MKLYDKKLRHYAIGASAIAIALLVVNCSLNRREDNIDKTESIPVERLETITDSDFEKPGINLERFGKNKYFGNDKDNMYLLEFDNEKYPKRVKIYITPNFLDIE